MAIKGLTPDEIRALPAVVDIPTAGRCLGFGPSKAYGLAKTGEFPLPLLPMGKTFRVPTAAILAYLSIEVAEAPSGGQAAKDVA